MPKYGAVNSPILLVKQVQPFHVYADAFTKNVFKGMHLMYAQKIVTKCAESLLLGNVQCHKMCRYSVTMRTLLPYAQKLYLQNACAG